MVTITNLRLPASWTTILPDDPAFDISANELNDFLDATDPIDWGGLNFTSVGNINGIDITAIQSGHIIEDEGVPLAQQTDLNFTGAGVTASDSGGKTVVDIPGTSPPHDLLDGSQNQDTVANVVTRGSVIFGNATPAWDELVKGTDGQFLKSNATDVLWAGIVKADISDFAHDLLSTDHSDTITAVPVQGDIVLANVTPAWAKLAIGTVDQVLTSDGTTASWQSLSVLTLDTKATPSVPEGTTAFPDVKSYGTFGGSISGHVFPDGVTEDTVTYKVNVPSTLASTPNARIVLRIATVNATATNETRWKIDSLARSDGESLNTAPTADTAGVDLTMSGSASIEEELIVNMNTAPTAGDHLFILVSRLSNHANDNYADQVFVTDVSLRVDIQ